MKHLNIIHLTDLHGNREFVEANAAKIESADLVAISGDLTHFGGKSQAADIIESILSLNPRVAAVPGNCDREGVSRYMGEMGISVEGTARKIDELYVCGMGGSLPAPVKTPWEFSEEQFSARFSELTAECDTPDIAVIHQPPANTKLDMVASGAHVGSNAVRDFLRQYQPVVCLTGHIHESSGIDTIGGTTVVNPGPAQKGFYAEIDIHDGTATVKLRSIDG